MQRVLKNLLASLHESRRLRAKHVILFYLSGTRFHYRKHCGGQVAAVSIFRLQNGYESV